MKVPDFHAADATARLSLATGWPVSPVTLAALGLRFWWRMPRPLRTTAAGRLRPEMVRRYVAEVRCARQSSTR